jgi:glycosyltransferase involved in cell wall biosynthesis
MKVLMISKALVVGAYQRKLEELARQPDLDLACVVPPSWRQDGRELRLERAFTKGYQLIEEPIRWNGNFHLFYFPGLPRQLSRLRPDIVHVDEEPYNVATFLATRLAVRHGSRPLFFTWQNIHRRYPPPFLWLERYVLRHTRHAMSGNMEAAEVIRRKGYRGPVAVIPQFGIDPIQFSPARGAQAAACGTHRRASAEGMQGSPRSDPAFNIEHPAPFTIGYVGRLVEEKGLWLLLEAVSGLEGDWRLTLFGHGPLAVPLRRRAAEMGLQERVVLRDPVPSIQVPDELRRLDVLVLPSLTRPNWKEQFGRVLVEAMACCVPVIGSQSGEIPNVIGRAGLQFPEGDPTALRVRLAELMSSPQLRAELGLRGRARVLERFTHERIAEATYRVYRQMVGLETIDDRPPTTDD